MNLVARFGTLNLVVPPGVYRPRSDTDLLAANLPSVAGKAVLELCAGSGALAITAAQRGATRVVAVDRCARAVLAVRVNARLNGVAVDARRGDLLGVLEPDEQFDVIVSNPPYLPVAPRQTAVDHRWDAGADGRAVLDRIVSSAAAHLHPGGTLALVQSGFAGIEQTADALEAEGYVVGSPVEHRGPLGPIAAERRRALVRAGLLRVEEDEERMAVVLARRPLSTIRSVAA